jgi:uncharacterized protein (TIGR03067 family)
LEERKVRIALASVAGVSLPSLHAHTKRGVAVFLSNLKPLTLVLLMLGLLAYRGGLLKEQAAVAQQPKPQSDEDKLRGRWKVIYAEQDGKPVANDYIYTFEEKGWVRTESSKGVFYPIFRRYTLDSSTNPKTLDLEWSVKFKGSYVLDGDTLVHRITLEWPDEKGTAVRQTLLLVFKRVEPIINK